MSDSEDEWTPPSEAQLKVIQAKRERSDKISKLMGDYLLKGYKMLATSCTICFTAELQDRSVTSCTSEQCYILYVYHCENKSYYYYYRSGNKFCVACQDVDCHETSKDDPALSEAAAERMVEEEAFSVNRQSAVSGDIPLSEARGGLLAEDPVTSISTPPPGQLQILFFC